MRREHLGAGIQQTADVEQAGPDDQLAGLHLGHVQDVIDQPEQHVAGLASQMPAAIAAAATGAIAQQAQGIQQGVQRRADFMADDGDEAGLRDVCGFGLGARAGADRSSICL